MMYSEFVEGTGCRENEHNYKVFRNLEIMYMNSDMTKAEIYEYGKKLVDNSKSEEELRVEAEINARIAEWKAELEHHRSEVKYYEEMVAYWKSEGDDYMTKNARCNVRYHKQAAKEARTRIAELKWILNS